MYKKHINSNKLLVILVISILITGCSSTKKDIKKPKKEVVKSKQQVNTYKDLNKTPIGIYQDKDKLILITDYTAEFSIDKDIAVFQVFPSVENNIIHTNKFAYMFYEKWNSLGKNNKIGFNIKYSTSDNKSISHNILNPSRTMDYGNYLQIYLYDDYYHRNDQFYSHIENNEYNENTLFTSIKLTGGVDINKINSPIELTVFTYDSPDDFNTKTKEYRGNSKYTIQIKRNN